MLGFGWLDWLHPDDRERTFECWQLAVADKAIYDVEYRIRRHDGVYRWFRTRGTPIRDVDGRIVHWYGTCTDIEEYKRLESALKETDRRKDEFLAMLAHELRNPLAPIKNGLQIIRFARDNAQKFNQLQEMIERQVKHLTRLVDDLLDVSRITSGKVALKFETIEIKQVLEHALETCRPVIEACRHEINVLYPSRLLYVNGDLMRLGQVVGNLLNNAAKYMTEGGQIWLSADEEEGQAVIRVRDNGIGIPKEMLQTVFEMFTQVDGALDRSHGGLGIGLALVRKLMEMHGGSVEARSKGIGRGSEFIVRLGLVNNLPAVAREPSPIPPSRNGPKAARRRVLIIDDNRDSADSLGMLMEFLDCEVRLAYEGLSGLEAAKEFQPNIVLLDIGMPGMSGHQVAQRLRQIPGCEKVLLIAQTGWGQEEDRLRSTEAGFDHHLVKPVDLNALTKMLDGFTATWTVGA